MEIAVELLQGVASLLALSLLYGFAMRHWPFGENSRVVLFGLIFGGVAIFGMMAPVQRAAGVILDPRTIIVLMASVFGGPVAGGISGAMAAGFRVFLGGAGAIGGVLVIIIAFLCGLAFRRLHQTGRVKLGALQFLVLGAFTHLLALVIAVGLYPVLAPEGYFAFAVPYLGIYSTGSVILGVLLQDLQHHYETERALRASEERLRAAYEGIPVGIVEIDFNGIIHAINRAAEKIFLCSAEEVIGKEMSIFMPEGRLDNYGGNLSAFLSQEVVPYIGQQKEVIAKRLNGEEFPLLGGAGEFSVGGKRFLIMLSSDQTELKAMEQKLLRSQRMEAVGELTGGIAHDFNNILGIVLGNLELLEEEAKTYPGFTKRIKSALKGAQRGAEITRKLLSFSRGTQSHGELVSINDTLTEMSPLISRSLTVSIQLEPHLGKDVWPVVADRGDLQDALLNLAINARDAMPDGGKIIIETENRIVDEEFARNHEQMAQGDYAVISFSDTGSGMTEEVKAHAFEPFFSTKAEGKGTGLGLSMVYGFVKRSRGHIDLYSELGRGTTFRIYLPRATLSATTVATGGQPAPLPVGEETILVVDDEAALTEIANDILSSLGYRVLQASDEPEAIRILEGPDHIDLLFTDVVLPGRQDGYRLVEGARKLRPEIRVLLTSGFSGKREAATSGHDAAVSGLMQTLLVKPYSRSDLAQAVRRALDAEPPADD